jgi:hypothetical protein
MHAVCTFLPSLLGYIDIADMSYIVMLLLLCWQVLNGYQRRKMEVWGKKFKRRMSKLFTVLLVMCAYCGTTTWDPKKDGWSTDVPSGVMRVAVLLISTLLVLPTSVFNRVQVMLAPVMVSCGDRRQSVT